MRLDSFSGRTTTRFALSLLILFALTGPGALAQGAKADKPSASSSSATTAAPPAVDERAAKVIESVVQAMGGSNYLNTRSVVGRGLFTQFREGVSGLPSNFVDYLVYPDRERTEFKGGGLRSVQTNVGKGGWIFDGSAKTVKDLTPAQVEEFRLALRTSVDALLRGNWRAEGATLAYAGRREAGLALRNEVLRLTYPDGFTVEFEFGARDHLPAKVLYKKKDSEGEEAQEEDRFAQFLNIEGIPTPFVIDHFRAGVQTSRINYESVEYNRPVPDSLFAKPANAKAIK